MTETLNPPPSFSLLLKLNKSEVYKGFHSTSTNFTSPPKIMCVCEMKATPVQSRAGLSDGLVPVSVCLLCFPLRTGAEAQGEPPPTPNPTPTPVLVQTNPTQGKSWSTTQAVSRY